ncbi:hypothetical protein [Methylomicrobium lacus]|uniref:S8 family serine peptidase n=1 Tax=Methylomicrobium lacus TaxID=136992 RepID=UPI0035A87CD4
MKDDNFNPYTAHRDIMLLLPWYINKTLGDAELKTVENHLRVCLTCRRELVEQQKLSMAVKQADTLDAAAQASFSRLQARIHRRGDSGEQTPLKVDARSPRLKGQRKFGFTMQGFPYQAIAALGLCLLLIPAYLIVNREFESNYRTLANSEIPAAHANEIRVVFSESADSEQRQSVVDSIAGDIVEGPNAMGVYLIRLKQVQAAGQVLDTLASLRKNSQVIFAEPAYALSSALSAEGKAQ